MECRENKLKEVMALDFKLYDIQLYLNTHPDDIDAIECYKELVEEADIARKAYEEMYGPITARNAAVGCEWTWIKNPWDPCSLEYI